MRISLNWIKSYVNLDSISVSEIIQKLTMAGLEVEDYVIQSELYNNIIVGEIKEVNKHPNADKLTVCKVFNGKEQLQVVCGAPNVAVGQKVVFAQIGSVIPKEKVLIKKTKIRGVESNGMICAEDELLLGDDHTGIIVLPEDFKPGSPISEVLALNDVIMEIGVTPNRPDALSHIGVARDLAAIFNKHLNYPVVKLVESGDDIRSVASVTIEDTVNCPRYVAKVIKGIVVKESPDWLKKRISQIGLRPINNVVDVTNFILHELGQPLHAFDLNFLAESKIIVRTTNESKRFTTLDSKQRELPEGTLMICDGKQEVAIAGIMGGQNSEITQSTKDILIESAYFNPTSIRRTSKKLQLSTDSSYRFERGTDYSNILFAAERAAQLIVEVAGGIICKGSIDVYPNPIKNKDVKLVYNNIKRHLGYEVETKRVRSILFSLGFNEIESDKESMTVSIPGYRPDVEREIDLVEEIARIHGYDNIPTISKISISLGEKHDDSEFAYSIRESAISLGLTEMINNPLELQKFAAINGEPIALNNPLSQDLAYLRTSLLSGALSTVERNINRGVKDLALFEIGNIFNRLNLEALNSFTDFKETQSFIILLSGIENKKTWNSEVKQYDIFSLKGLLKAFIQKISLDNVLTDFYYSDVKSNYDLYFEKKYNAELIGWGGRVKRQTLDLFGIDKEVYAFEFNLDKLKIIPKKPKYFKQLQKYPGVVRDFAFIFDIAVTYEDVKNFIIKNSSTLLKDVNLFDLFISDNLGQNKKSMAFTLDFFDENRTLTEEEVEKDFKNLIEKIIKEFNATLRGI